MLKIKLYELRVSKGLVQEDMAKIMGVSQATYSRWETSSEIIPLTKLNYLCNYFRVSMDYITGITDYNTYTKEYFLDKKLIGANLKEFRKTHKLTQVQLASILNTTQSTISAYESGETLILTSFLLQIAQCYHISIDKLCNRC